MLSASLAIYERNPLVISGFPSQRACNTIWIAMKKSQIISPEVSITNILINQFSFGKFSIIKIFMTDFKSISKNKHLYIKHKLDRSDDATV